ncbi:MAG: DUF819 family protein [Candidatus Marinimicrobia bacterium]|jgi:uncharacterized membrane protein|nr:DUF819 family protein [Candidatus Neomarinimicrobiota bacterium]MBT3631114.1 DUF819 family protein [Candidatus Neomarinimicrobiota bacterium]MBT3825754.1 DUF819 family protein [Candidatus Neomarinimicrobiota bacterium]MBT4130502.1 DUF819 family protein [Candidatus Neomarinimicrobiota bacterium]MBT4297079.1 DUF819 family protein [Candidatus Neomarinimicrobiota bacterium]
MPLINDPTAILVYLISLIGLIYYAKEQAWSKKLFDIVPPVIWVYFLPMISTTLGITPEQSDLYSWVKTYLLPAALVLLLLSADVKAIAKLGPKALGTMLGGTIGIVLGGVISLALFGAWLPEDAWQGLGALSGSWIGGSANMVAVGTSIGVRDELFGVMIIVDTVVGYGWMGVVIFISSFQTRLDKWNGVTESPVDDLSEHLANSENSKREPLTFSSLIFMVVVGFGLGFLSLKAGEMLPDLGKVVTSFGWTVILVSLVGLGLSFTPVARLEKQGASHMGNMFLYLLLATIGAKADLRAITEAPMFLAVGVLWIGIHATILFSVGRMLKAPMFLIATSSQANIGGVVSAPIVASVYQKGMAPVGLLMGVLGNILGLYFGFLTAQLMEWVSRI